MSATLERITVTAPDISCGHCVATVQEVVGDLVGVNAVTANADTKRVEVTFDPSRVSVTEIETAMDDAGYPVKN